ncbi:MAG TPA: cyclic nucleotide-binding domain-containing protein [Anaerolineae bacterium]|nr:cyclic nucleotide-binding domain-containing protein [Anaerolineae bacterium]
MPIGLTEEETEYLAGVLRRVPLFSELRDHELRALVEIAQLETYRAGAELYRQSDVDNVLYVLLSGQVSLYHVDPAGVESFVGLREPGPEGWLGEASVLLGDAHDVTVIAFTDVRVLELERKALQDLLQQDQGLRGRLNMKPENADRFFAPHYGWQAADETVVKMVREHKWALFRRLLIPIGLLIGLGIIAVVFHQLLEISIFGGIVVVLTALAFMAVAFFLFIDWHDDFYVVTNKRVVHVDQIPGVRQKLEEAPLSTIQEIQFARNSIIAHLLDFGDLRVETFAGSVAMRDVPEPEQLKSLIFREIEKVRSRARAAARKAIRDELTRRVGQQGPQPPAPPQPVVTVAERPATLGSVLGGVLRYFFPKLREVSGDSIIYRKHWVALLRKTKVPFIGLFLTIASTLNWWSSAFPLGGLPDEFWLVWLALLVIFAAWSLWIFEDWRNDLYIVTSTRIIDLQRIPFLLQETRKESGLDKIQTLEVNIPSPLARLFRFGNVIVRVPGAVYNFNDVQNPAAIQGEISKRVDQFKRRQAENEARGRRTELSDWFAVYEQIKTGYQASETPGSSERKADGAA